MQTGQRRAQQVEGHGGRTVMTASTGAWPVDQTFVTTPSEGRHAIVSRDVASCDSRAVGSRKSCPSILA